MPRPEYVGELWFGTLVDVRWRRSDGGTGPGRSRHRAADPRRQAADEDDGAERPGAAVVPRADGDAGERREAELERAEQRRRRSGVLAVAGERRRRGVGPDPADGADVDEQARGQQQPRRRAHPGQGGDDDGGSGGDVELPAEDLRRRRVPQPEPVHLAVADQRERVAAEDDRELPRRQAELLDEDERRRRDVGEHAGRGEAAAHREPDEPQVAEDAEVAAGDRPEAARRRARRRLRQPADRGDHARRPERGEHPEDGPPREADQEHAAERGRQHRRQAHDQDQPREHAGGVLRVVEVADHGTGDDQRRRAAERLGGPPGDEHPGVAAVAQTIDASV